MPITLNDLKGLTPCAFCGRFLSGENPDPPVCLICFQCVRATLLHLQTDKLTPALAYLIQRGVRQTAHTDGGRPDFTRYIDWLLNSVKEIPHAPDHRSQG